MPFCSADDFVFTGFCGCSKACVGRSTWLNFDFPEYVGDIFIIEEIASRRAQFHDDEIMDNGPCIRGIECNLLPRRDSKLIWLKLKVGHRDVDRRRRPTTAARCYYQTEKNTQHY